MLCFTICWAPRVPECFGATIVWALRVSECFGFQYFGRFQRQNASFYNNVGASGAEMLCFLILWVLPGMLCFTMGAHGAEMLSFTIFGCFRGLNALFYNTLGGSGAEMFSFTILWALPEPKCIVLQYCGCLQSRNVLFYNTLGASGV